MTGLAGAAPAIMLQQAARVYPGPPPVAAVRGVNLTVPRGDYLAITGPSGSGKSTLMNLLGLLDRLSSGRYLLDGVDVSQCSQAELAAVRAHRIGFVFQGYHLLPYRTATENVMLGLLYAARLRVRERAHLAGLALTRVGLRHRVAARPAELSGGECQRVAIARALINRPSMLLCDEPTGNLDSGTAQTILGLLDELNAEGQTVLVVTHDPVVAARARRRVTILDGRLLEET